VRSFDFGAKHKATSSANRPDQGPGQKEKTFMTVEAVKTNRVTRDPSIVHAAKNETHLKEVNSTKGTGLSPQQRSQLENNVPQLLRDACGWVCWKFSSSDNPHKMKKIPIDPTTGGLVDVNDETVGGTLAEAMDACGHFRADGVGYLMVPLDHLVGVDLDKCRDAATGKIIPWAAEVIRHLNSYTEVTPSGRGVRVWVEGKWPYSNNCRSGLGENVDGKIEVYSRSRFFTVTGLHVEGTPTAINRNQAALDKMYERFWSIDSSKKSSSRSHATGARTQAIEDDATLLKKAFAAENGKKFKRLWDGECQTEYASRSEADMALAGHLAFWTGCDEERMDSLFRQSGRFRPKWDENHFANGDTYLQHTIRVAIENSTATYGGDASKTSPPDHGGVSVCIADVQSHPVEWLWRGWIPKGKLTLLEGDPGVAKSLLTLELAARITKGLPMPDGSHCERGSVVIVNAEDGLEDTVKPRLEVAGADMRRCHWLNFSLEDQQTLIIPGRMDALKKKIEECKAVLVIIDPLVAFLEKRINSWNDQDVRRAMAALSQLAEQTGAAIVLIRHLNKKEDVKNKIYRGGGSIAFIAAVRSGLLVAPDSHDSSLRVLSTTKANLSSAPTPLIFGIESVEYHGAEEGMPQIVWHGEQSQTVGRPASSNVHEKTSALEDAKEFLRESLGRRPQKSTQVCSDAGDSKISLATLHRAKAALNVKSVRDGFGDEGVWYWKLPSAE
jgi:putative DNA primase/helicase